MVSADPATVERKEVATVKKKDEAQLFQLGECDLGEFRLVSVRELLDPADPAIVVTEWKNLKLNENRVVTEYKLQYAAISHVWKTSHDATRLSSSEKKIHIDLGGGKTQQACWLGLYQAAKAADHLKCFYLWVDLLCIKQSDNEDKKRQIPNMANIYVNAKAVLVMFGGCEAAQGINHDSEWITRAWTLQESTINEKSYGLISTRNFGDIEYEDSYEIELGGTIERLGEDIGYIKLRELLELAKHQYLGNVTRIHEGNRSLPYEVKLPIKCFSDDKRAMQLLEIVLDSINGVEKGPEGDAIVKSAAWHSIWTRKSEHSRDMVFSMMHLLGVNLGVNYEKDIEGLFREVVHQSCRIGYPAWLTILPTVEVTSNSGLVPELPQFLSNVEPFYDDVLASSVLADIDSMIDMWDIFVHSGDEGKRFTLCGKTMGVTYVPTHTRESRTVSLSFRIHKKEFTAECDVFNELGTTAMIVGRLWKTPGHSHSLCNICIIFLEKKIDKSKKINMEKKWMKVGQGTLTINEEMGEILSEAERNHMDIRTSKPPRPCDCFKKSAKCQFLDYPLTKSNFLIKTDISSSPTMAERKFPGPVSIDVKREIDHWTELIHQNPSDLRHQTNLAEAYAKTGDIRQVIKGWQSLVDQFPKEWKLQTQLENAFASKEKLQKAWAGYIGATDAEFDEIDTWKKLVQKYPEEWSLQVHLEKAFSRKGDINQEISGWKYLVGKHPQEWKLHTELARAYTKKASGESTKEEIGYIIEEIMGWKDLVNEHPDVWELQIRLADAYSRKSKMAQAVRVLEGRVGTSYGDSIIKISLGTTVKLMREINSEIEDWETLVRRHPESHGLQMQLEMAYNKRKVADRPIEGWSGLLDQHPKQREFAIQLKTAYEKKIRLKALLDKTRNEGESVHKNRSIDEEISGWKTLVRKHPAESTLQSHLSEAFMKKNGSAAEEIATWVNLLNLHPQEKELRARLLYACLECGDIDMAMQELKRLETGIPENDELPSVLLDMYQSKIRL